MGKETHFISSEKKTPQATHYGRMRLGDLILDCFVLEDGRRLFHKRGMAKALGFKSGGGNVFSRSMRSQVFGSHFTENLLKKIENPIHFNTVGQDLSPSKKAHGFEADVLAEIASVIASCYAAGDLSPHQMHLGERAKLINAAFAKIGVIALIDEATGYQQIRDPNALAIFVNQYISDEKREWEKVFPDKFYNELNRLHGNPHYTQNHLGTFIQYRPSHFAGFTRKYIYGPLENGGVLKELDRINPTIKGTRESRLHQHLSQDYGLPKLKRQVNDVMTLMSVSDDIFQFKVLFDKKYKMKNFQSDLFVR